LEAIKTGKKSRERMLGNTQEDRIHNPKGNIEQRGKIKTEKSSEVPTFPIYSPIL